MPGIRLQSGLGPRLLVAFTAFVLLAVIALTPVARASTEGGPACGAYDGWKLAPSQPLQSKRATVLFIPGPVRTPRPALAADFQQLPGFSVGLFSPTLGRYTPMQMMLDISQGARVASSLYKPVTPPRPGLVLDDRGGAWLPGWRKLEDRAAAVPGDVLPGLMACAVTGAKMRVEWVGLAGDSTLSSVVAADRVGRVVTAGFASQNRLANSLKAAQRDSILVVGQLPPGGVGYRIARELAKANPERLIILVQSPPDPARTRLLTLAVRGVGDEGGLTSATTRRNGLVAATDIAPTVLERLGIEEPTEMQGQPIESAPFKSAEELNEMNDRLSLVAGRRAPLGRDVIVLGGLFLILLLLAGRLTGRFEPTLRLAQRIVGLAILWLPLFLLITAALRPSRAIEADIAVFGSIMAAWLTDRVVQWPRALWVPALAVLIAHGADFVVLGGELTGESLLGSNPLYGARFFGVGNELEAVMCVSAVLGTGAALSGRSVAKPARWFAAAGMVLALYLGAGRIGADVGGVVFAAAAFGAAALYVAKLRLTVLRAFLIALVPIVGLVVIGLLDAVSSGESHLTRTVFEANGPGELITVFERRLRASVEGAKSDGVWVIVLFALAMLIWGWIRRDRIFAPLVREGEDPTPMRPFRAGVVGGFAGTIIGALANDSGPAILIIGTIYVGMGVLYMRGRPIAEESAA